MPYPPTPTNVWDTTQPPDTQLLNQGAGDLRGVHLDVMQRLAQLSGTLANRPTPETVNAVWGGSGFGLTYFATDTKQIFQWNGSAWIELGYSLPSVGAVLLNPTVIGNTFVWRTPFRCTAKTVHGLMFGGTSVTLNAGLSGPGDFLASDMTLSSGTAVDSSVTQNGSFGVGNYMYVRVDTVVGAVTQLLIQVDFTRP